MIKDSSATLEAPTLHTPSTISRLPSGWIWRRLDQICEGVFDCPHSTPVLTEDGPLIARSQDIRTGVFDLEGAGKVSEETFLERIDRAEPRHGDLLYSREGTYFGIAAEIPEGIRVCLGQRMVLIRPRPGIVDARYLRYWLNSPAMVLHVHGHRDGTVAERLNMPTIRALPAALPPVEEQVSIAEMLGSLDDKIELNRRMNETLQATTKALFRASFAPALHGFKGWRQSTIGEEVRVIGGSTPSTSKPEFWEGGSISWATPKDLSNLETPFLLRTERRITDLGLAQIGSGLLPAGTVLISSRAPIGYLAISEIPIAINQGFIAMVCDKRIPPVYAWLWAEQNMDKIKARANGTTFQEISKANFRPIPVDVPPKPLLERFIEAAEPLGRRIVANVQESANLAQIRDSLLPRLLSGEARWS